jgi:hypothetical protein
MKKLPSLLYCCLLFSSCATLLNSGTQKINIYTDKRIKVISVAKSLSVFNDSDAVYVERSKSPLTILVQLDSIPKTVAVTSTSSLAFWSNIYFNYGLGMLVDMNNAKRYAYPKNIYLQAIDSNVIVKSILNNNKSILVKRLVPPPHSKYILHLALPYINHFIVNTIDGNRNSTGFFGLESGLDYHYKPKQFASLYFGVATDIQIPFPAPLDVWGEQERSSSFYISARNNHTINNFTLGYGLSYAALKWTKSNNTDTSFKTQTSITSAIGLSCSAAYRLGRSFQLGLLYQPYFFEINKQVSYNYQQQLSFEFIWKIPFKSSSAKK